MPTFASNILVILPLHSASNKLLMIDMNKAIIFIFAALLTISCVGRQETAEEKGDHVNTFYISNDTLTIEPVNGDCMAPYPFGFQKPLLITGKIFLSLKRIRHPIINAFITITHLAVKIIRSSFRN